MSKLLLGGVDSGEEAAKGVSFDGVSDYLSRSTDLVGNTDSKTFTFSCWVYYGDSGSNQTAFSFWDGSGYYFYLDINATKNVWSLTSYNIDSSAYPIDVDFSANIPAGVIKNTWVNVVISADLTSTSNRFIYINDVPASSVNWIQYNNIDIPFSSAMTAGGCYVGQKTGSGGYIYGRLSNVFLDYTYRDLSIEANRRLFITEDLKPADNQESLNPILYLPMDNADTAHINLGTGGDFVPNGVLDTAQRGANQYNCVASEFDGVDDYLSRGALVGVSDSKLFTVVFDAFRDTDILNIPFGIADSAVNYGLQVQLTNTANGNSLKAFGRNSANNLILNIESDEFVITGKHYRIALAMDMTNSTKTRLYINDLSVNVTQTTVANDSLDFTRTNTYVGYFDNPTYHNGTIGELYFDTTYIDLATDNPFWDSTTNKPKPVRQVLEETGNTPLIAMPISADNPTLNLGTGGDFTLNGGGLVGARGASEFIARSMQGDGVAKNLTLSSANPFGSDTKTGTVVCVFKADVVDDYVFSFGNTELQLTASPSVNLWMRTTTGVDAVHAQWSSASTATWYVLLLSVDVNSTATRYASLNGVAPAWNVYNNQTLRLSNALGSAIGSRRNNTSYFDGDIGLLYYVDSYIDFSQEENRNLFVDQLGYPKDLQKQIDDGLIPAPLIYMPFDDPDYLGKNLGTGGDFTVNGTVTQGADFSI